jgi:hypothetical protein
LPWIQWIQGWGAFNDGGLLLQGVQFVKLNFSHNGTSRRILGLRGFGSFGANNFEKSLKISGALLVHLKTKVLPIA